jgi:hypothetical protein
MAHPNSSVISSATSSSVRFPAASRVAGLDGYVDAADLLLDAGEVEAIDSAQPG